MCTSDGGNYSPTDKESDKVRRVRVYFLNCLIHQVEVKPGNRHPSALHHTQKQTLARCETLSALVRAFTFAALTHVEANQVQFETLPPLTAATDPHALNHTSPVLTACDGAENIFPSLWLGWIGRRINHNAKQRNPSENKLVAQEKCAAGKKTL